MKEYEVLVPITGYIIVNVNAENKEDAVNKAFESDELTLDNIEQWDSHECVVKGNVFYGTVNEIEVNEV